MNKKKKLQQLILEYENFIRLGNTNLKEIFHTQKSPLQAMREGIIPRSGVIKFGESDENMFFQFHGIGCRFELNNLVVEFDYSFGDFLYKGFDSSKLFLFVKNHPKSGAELSNNIIFEQCLLELEEHKVIVKNTNSIDTYDYIFMSAGAGC
jgi:hypothetical protein